MSEFLLEIYGEEIPSSTQDLLELELKRLFEELLKRFDIKFDKIITMSTSRRVVLFIKDLPKITKKKINLIKGPKVNSKESAITGFLKSNSLKDTSQLSKKEINGNLYYLYEKQSGEKKISNLLEENLPILLRSIRWIKSMRWGNHEDRWIRPIKNILCIFDKKVIKFSYAGLESCNHTYGNYYFGEKKFKCSNYVTYRKQLEKYYVIVDRLKREKKIKSKIEEFCKRKNLVLDINASLLKRTSDSVENPNVFFGEFDKKFFKLPEFLIENIVTDKQDFFSFKSQNKMLSNNFCFVSNLNNNKKKQLIKGTQNVLKARFSDASFFLNEDQKIGLRERNSHLNNIIFYQNAGNLYERSVRISLGVQFIYKKINKKINFETDYLSFSNADLATELVNEYPGLQGKVGGYYAYNEKFPKEVYQAFSDQYEYEYSVNYNNFLTFILSITQKFDAILGYFISKKSLKGTGDPFGIRRAALSIIKICLEKKIDFNFNELFSYLKKIYQEQNIQVEMEYETLYEFFKKRIEILFEESGFYTDVIRASFADNAMNPHLTFLKVNKLQKFLKTKDGISFLQAFKRLDSLNEECQTSEIDENLFNQKEEMQFYEFLCLIDKKLNNLGKECLLDDNSIVNKTTLIINNFFDNVIVNDDNMELRKNRKKLINHLHKALKKSYNFSFLLN